MSPEAMLSFDAVRLFVTRANDADRRLVLTAENAAAVSQICRRLDGIPLALELAAARTTFLALPELARRLDDRFTLLTGGSRTSALRHQTLEAAIDWGYGLLEPQERMLFCRLSVFAGKFTLSAAEAVCQGRGVDPEMVMHALAGLLHKSFVSADTQGEVTHYRILETLRAYGAKNLTAADDAPAVQSRLLQWGIDLAHEAEPHLKGDGQQAWIKVIDDNVDNIRSVLSWASDGADPNGALELVVALQRFWELRSVKEGRVWVETLLRAAGPHVPPRLRMKALTVAGVLAAHEGDHQRVRSVYEDCLTVSRRFSLDEGVGKALLGLGHVAYMQGDYGAARRLCGESLELGRRGGDLRTVAASLNVLGRVAHFQCRYEEAHAELQESLVVRKNLGDSEWIAVALGALGDLAYRRGDYAAGRAYCDESLQIARAIGVPHQQAWALSLLSDLDLAEGNIVSAGAGLESSLQMFRELGDRSCTVRTLYRLSRFERARGDWGRSVWLLREALSLSDASGERISVIECLEQLAEAMLQSGDRVAAAVLLGFADGQRVAMEAPLPDFAGAPLRVTTAALLANDVHWMSAWNSGRRMSFPQAVEFALRTSSEMRGAQ
jgi:non-specific serine/threonine protein kinase